MNQQQKDLILGALRIGENQIKLEYLLSDGIYKDLYKIKGEKIRAAIKELEAMQTKEVK